MGVCPSLPAQECQPPEDTCSGICSSPQRLVVAVGGCLQAHPTFFCRIRTCMFLSSSLPGWVRPGCLLSSAHGTFFLLLLCSSAVFFSDNKPCVLASSTTSKRLEPLPSVRKHQPHEARQVKKTEAKTQVPSCVGHATWLVADHSGQGACGTARRHRRFSGQCCLRFKYSYFA